MAEYVNKSMLYSLCEPRGVVTLHVSDIDAMHSEDVAPVVHARWIKCFDERKVLNCHSGTAFKCSHCNRRAGHKQIKLYDFCPKCGAIMDAKEDG